MGYEWGDFAKPFPGAGPFLLAERVEGDDLPTVLGYGHGDVIRGYDEQWRDGLSPWTIVEAGDRIYGRGTADNKGQHSVHMSALAAVLESPGRLGFHSKFMIEMGEANGSQGLAELVQAQRAIGSSHCMERVC